MEILIRFVAFCNSQLKDALNTNENVLQISRAIMTCSFCFYSLIKGAVPSKSKDTHREITPAKNFKIYARSMNTKVSKFTYKN